MHFPRPSLLVSRAGLGSIAAAAAAAMIAACSSSSNGSSPDSGGTPTFTELYANILSPLCATQCHNPGAPGVTQGMLDMSTQTLAYNNLVNVEAMGVTSGAVTGCGGKGIRVIPGNVDMSILAEKVDPTLFASLNCGNLMPQGGMLTSDQIDSIESWIKAGAPNN